MKKLILFVILLSPTIARCQGVSVSGQAVVNQPVSVSGIPGGTVLQAVPNAQITVCSSAGGGIPCSPLVTIYSNVTLTTIAANPLTADINGNFSFFIPPNATGYLYSQTAPGIVGQLFTISPATTTLTSGTILCKNFEQVRCVDSANSAGWAGTDACAWINSAIANLPTLGGFAVGDIDIRGLASNALVTCATTVNAGSPYLKIFGPGHGQLRFSCTMNADCFNTQINSTSNSFGFYLGGFSLVGTGATNANANGIHAGDMVGGRFEDIQIDNFLGANSSCLWLENHNGFFENNIFINIGLGQEITGAASNTGCTKELRGSVNAAGGSGNISFAYSKFYGIHFGVYANQTMISIEGGSWVQQTWSGVTFNVTTATGTTVLVLSGSTFPGSGINTPMNGFYDISGECTGCSGATFYNVGAGYTIDIQGGRITGGTGFNYTTSATIDYRWNQLPVGTPIICNYSSAGVQNNCYNIVINNPGSARNLSINDPGANADFIFSQGYAGSKGLSIGGPAGTSAVAGDITAQRSATLGVYWMGTDNNGFLLRNGNTAQISYGTVNQVFPSTSDTLTGRATTDTLTNKTLNVPLSAGTAYQPFNTTTTCTTGAAVGATCTTAAITLPAAEADTSYRVTCTGKGLTNVPVVIATANSSATQFTITIAALTAAAASFASYDCVVGHN